MTRDAERGVSRSLGALGDAGPAGHVMLDLWTANEELLERAGVDPERIETRGCAPPVTATSSTRTARAIAAVSSPSPHFPDMTAACQVQRAAAP